MTNNVTRLILTAAVLLLATPGQAALVLLDRIAVIVDEDVIMQSVIEQRLATVKARLATSSATAAPSDEAIKKQIIEQLIVESLQLQMAKKAGVRVSDEELNEAMRGIATQNEMTLEQLREAIAKDAISWQETREQIRREIVINRVQQGVMQRRIQVTEQEIKNFLASETGETVTSDEYHIAHILLSIPGQATADDIREVKEKANHVRQLLDEGADFQTLAIEWSSDQNALEGGDMGWRKPVQLPSMFSGLVENMAVGEVAGPVKSGKGYHLVKLLEKRGAAAEGQINQSKVRHVLIKPNEIRNEEEAEALTRRLRDAVNAGLDFAEVARLNSDDPGSALSGGDLGWNRAGVFMPRFEEVIKASELNTLSEVFKTEHGYHFLEVTGHRVEDFTDRFKMGQADSYLRNRKFDEELESWIREIRDGAFVEIKTQE